MIVFLARSSRDDFQQFEFLLEDVEQIFVKKTYYYWHDNNNVNNENVDI